VFDEELFYGLDESLRFGCQFLCGFLVGGSGNFIVGHLAKVECTMKTPAELGWKEACVNKFAVEQA